MAADEEVIILARLAGTRQFIANSTEMSGAVRRLGYETDGLGRAMDRTTKRGYLMNQALFTVRRMVYGVTLLTIGAGVAALKMGQDYNNAMQTATVALRPFFATSEDLTGALDRLWKIAAFTPFRIKDMTLAFRALYPSMKTLGLTSDDVIDTLAAVIDGLSVAGKVSGPALTRVTTALQHMAFQGRLTGRTINQLAQDGLPIFAILNTELGLTGDQLHDVAKLGIPAGVVMQAIIKYMQTTPGYAGAALKQSTMTFQGIWSTFQDYVSRAMGMLEHGLFLRFQDRMNSVNAWFTRLFDKMNAQGGNLSAKQIIGSISPAAAMLWEQIAADVHLFWTGFSHLVSQFIQSKPLWAIIYASLVSIHGILLLVVPLTNHFGTALYVLIPLFVTWKVVTYAAATANMRFVFTEALATKATKDLTFAQFLARMALYAYYFTLGRVIVLMATFRAAAAAYTTAIILMTTESRLFNWALRAYYLTLGRIILLGGAIRLFAAKYVTALILMTTSSRAYAAATRAMIFLQILLRAALYQTARAFIVMTLAMMANPVGIIVAAVVLLVAGLVILYFKWNWFHNAVDRTFQWIRSNWRTILLVAAPLLGPITLAIAAVIRLWDTIKRFYAWLKSHNPVNAVKSGDFWKGIGKKALAIETFGLSTLVPGLASGGIAPGGMTLVGERGPELVSLPAGARVYNAQDTRSFRPQEAWENKDKKPLLIQLMLNKRILEEIMVEIEGDRVSRA